MKPLAAWTAVLARIVLGLVMLVAASAKGTDLTALSRQIELILMTFGIGSDNHLLDWTMIPAVLVVLVEFVIAAGILAGFRIRLFARLLQGLLILFTVLTLAGLATGGLNDCGCFGALVKRTPLTSLVENLVLLALTIPLLSYHHTRSKKSRFLFSYWLVVSFVWCLTFYLHPPAWSVARPGVKWNYPTLSVSLTATQAQYFWMFDPECADCLARVTRIDTLAQQGLPLIAVTSATSGRIAEFEWDFQPSFPLRKVNKQTLISLGLPSGSLVRVEQGVITNVWSIRNLDD